MKLLQSIRDLHSPAQCNDGVALCIGRRQPSDKIGHTRAGGSDRYSRFTGHSTDAASDKGCILFMTADHGLNARIDEGIENLIDLCPWHPKDELCAVPLERFHYDIRTRHSFLLVGSHASFTFQIAIPFLLNPRQYLQ